MDIYILRDGKETGPYTEEAAHGLLKQGQVVINDLAWRPGMSDWIPLHSVLFPVRPPAPPMPVKSARVEPTPDAEPQAAPAIATVAAAAPSEPATAKQKAFLSYMGIAFANDISKENASVLVNDTMENPKSAALLAKWNDDRLKLHPELFADEIKTRRENRASHYFEVVQKEGAEYFSKFTKAHSQVLVGYLDVHHPTWESDKSPAWNFFFPAIAEKFPQLVNKSAKGKFKFPDGPKVAVELSRRTELAKPKREFPAKAIFGFVAKAAVFFGIIGGGIKGVDWYLKNEGNNVESRDFAEVTRRAEKIAAASAAKTESDDEKPAKASRKKMDEDAAETPEPKTKIVSAEPAAAAPAGAPMAAPAAAAPMSDAPAAPAAGAPMAAAPMAGAPMSDAPAATAPAATAPAAPMAAAPAPVELAPVPAEPAPAAAPAPPAPKTTLMITKPAEVQLPFGKAVLRPGTQVRIVANDGALIRVLYGKDIVTVPASSTDFAADASALPPAAAPAAPAAPAPGAVTASPAATPKPSSQSLF